MNMLDRRRAVKRASLLSFRRAVHAMCQRHGARYQLQRPGAPLSVGHAHSLGGGIGRCAIYHTGSRVGIDFPVGQLLTSPHEIQERA
jgi:hypothetical protein